MPTNSTGVPQKRKLTTGFKPPRVVNKGQSTCQNVSKSSTRKRDSASKAAKSAASIRRRLQVQDDSDEDESASEDDTMPSETDEQLDRGEDDNDPGTEVPSSTQPSSVIPPALLTRLFYHFFEHNDRTRMTPEARFVAGKYIETFTREAIARAALERSNAIVQGEQAGEIGAGDFLEVGHCSLSMILGAHGV